MLIGYNNDIEHRGVTFHIQTEDRGSTDNKIETQLFHGGAILDTKITSYEEIVEGLEGEARNKKIKSVMKASHRSLFKNLLAGKYDEQVGLEPLEKTQDELRQAYRDKIKEFQPGQDRVPQAAVELEEDGIDALQQEAAMEGFEDPADQEHVDLSSLKDQLESVEGDDDVDIEDADINLTGEDDSSTEEEEVPETQIIDPPSDFEIEADAKSNISDSDDKVTADTDKLETMRVSGDDIDTEQLESVNGAWQQERTSPVGNFSTGVRAWTGCDEPDEDLSIDALVEEQLTG